MQLPFIVAATAALAPGAHAWWTGRALIQRTADPAFPELIFARRQRGIQILATAIALLLVFARAHSLWVLPLLIVTALAGGFPFRRALYGETWSLFDYINYATASTVGAAGFWLLLGFTPSLILALVRGWIPGDGVVAAAVMGVLFGIALLVWERSYPRVWLALHRATPLDRPDLQQRIDEITRRTGIAAPAVFRYGAPGSYTMNAIALPSTDAPRVAFGDTLLELLPVDEIAAIFAHEVAHLEHYDRRVIGRLHLATVLLVIIGVALPAALLTAFPGRAALIALAWPVLVLVALLTRVAQNQAHESVSDRRSAELLGDPEPMIRALTRLHHHSRLPRRWAHDFERSASHPSLARRIQALRAAAPMTAGAALPSLAAPTVLRTTVAGKLIALDATRIYWLEGTPNDIALPINAETLTLLRERATTCHAIAYSDLTELRVGITGTGRALVARNRSGKTWSTPLAIADVATAQAALDMLDGQLAAPVRTGWSRPARAFVACALIMIILVLLRSLTSGPREMTLAWTVDRPELSARMDVGATAMGVALSPSGRLVAIQAADSVYAGFELDELMDLDPDETIEWQYTIVDSTGPRRTTAAYSLAFANDAQVLALRPSASSTDSMVISLESARHGDSTVWRRTIPAVPSASIRVNGSGERWTIFGYDADESGVVVITGSAASDSVVIRHETFADLGGLPLLPLADGSMLVSKMKEPSAGRRLFTALGIMRVKWEVVQTGNGSRTLLGSLAGYPECTRSIDGEPPLCVAHDRDGRTLWRIDDELHLVSLGALPPDLDITSIASGNRIVARTWTGGSISVIDPADGTARQMVLDTPSGGAATRVRNAAIAGGTTVVLLTTGRQSEMRLYRDPR